MYGLINFLQGEREYSVVCPLKSTPVTPDFFPALSPPFLCPLLHVSQRSQVKGWNMRGALSLGTVPGLNIDLPPQTILDIELVEETTVRRLTCCCCYHALSLLLARWGILKRCSPV